MSVSAGGIWATPARPAQLVAHAGLRDCARFYLFDGPIEDAGGAAVTRPYDLLQRVATVFDVNSSGVPGGAVATGYRGPVPFRGLQGNPSGYFEVDDFPYLSGSATILVLLRGVAGTYSNQIADWVIARSRSFQDTSNYEVYTGNVSPRTVSYPMFGFHDSSDVKHRAIWDGKGPTLNDGKVHCFAVRHTWGGTSDTHAATDGVWIGAPSSWDTGDGTGAVHSDDAQHTWLCSERSGLTVTPTDIFGVVIWERALTDYEMVAYTGNPMQFLLPQDSIISWIPQSAPPAAGAADKGWFGWRHA